MTTHTIPSPAAATARDALARGADEELAQQIRAHHAGMVDELDRLTSALRDSAPEAQQENRARLVEWFETVLVPHADEEEQTTYLAAGELPEAGRSSRQWCASTS